MKWLTIDYIKAHSRIDYDCEDSLLELYGDAAEATVMNIIGRTYDEIVEKFGTDTQEIPAPLIQASLILVDTSYQFRAAISTQNIYQVLIEGHAKSIAACKPLNADAAIHNLALCAACHASAKAGGKIVAVKD